MRTSDETYVANMEKRIAELESENVLLKSRVERVLTFARRGTSVKTPDEKYVGFVENRNVELESTNAILRSRADRACAALAFYRDGIRQDVDKLTGSEDETYKILSPLSRISGILNGNP